MGTWCMWTTRSKGKHQRYCITADDFIPYRIRSGTGNCGLTSPHGTSYLFYSQRERMGRGIFIVVLPFWNLRWFPWIFRKLCNIMWSLGPQLCLNLSSQQGNEFKIFWYRLFSSTFWNSLWFFPLSNSTCLVYEQPQISSSELFCLTS